MAATDADRPGAQQFLPTRHDVESLRQSAATCRGCELWEPATQVVFSSGRPNAPIMMVGEQPGDVEDREGEPFVGPAGRLLRRACDDAGIAADDVYLTNAVKHFRFEQRGKRRIHTKPDLGQMVACLPWLEAEVEAVDPDVVVVLGATAARSLLGPAARVTKERGELRDREVVGQARPVLLTVHPSAILRVRDGRTAAYEGFVGDLRVAAGAVG